jgi:hypothetical protein
MGDENGTERIKGIQLPSDTGLHWIDQHAERVPQHQFEPVFQALSVMNPSVRFDNVDIVVNRSSLQLLLRLLKNQSTQAFHLDLDVVGKTLFIGRKPRTPCSKTPRATIECRGTTLADSTWS